MIIKNPNKNIVYYIASLSQQIDVSRLNINDNNLPEPKDSDDYCEQDNDIISMKYSGISLNVEI
jgi:hypothetical protein